MNAKKLYNWVCQLEFYCRIQNLQDDDIKIQLSSLRLEGATLVWREFKAQEELKKMVRSQFLGLIPKGVMMKLIVGSFIPK